MTALEDIRTKLRMNGGYFLIRREFFDYLEEGDELVEEPFTRLIAAGLLRAYEYDGFWAPMDTLKDHQVLQNLYDAGRPPWAIWRSADVEPPGPPS